MKQILRIDPTTLSHSHCLEKVRLSNTLGLCSKIPDHKIDFGSGFHKAIAVWQRTKSLDAAIAAAQKHSAETKAVVPDKDYRNAAYLEYCVMRYIQEYKFDTFTPMQVGDRFGVELPFKVPYKAYEHVDVILCGVVDSVGQHTNRIVFKDIKTTASRDPKSYFSSYEVSTQMMIYSWALRKLGLVDYYPPSMIDGVFLSASDVRFQRSNLITFRDDLIEDCMQWVEDRVDAIVAAMENRKPWVRNFSACSGKFGMCEFFPVCSVQEAYREGVIERNFSTRVYDPMTFGD